MAKAERGDERAMGAARAAISEIAEELDKPPGTEEQGPEEHRIMLSLCVATGTLQVSAGPVRQVHFPVMNGQEQLRKIASQVVGGRYPVDIGVHSSIPHPGARMPPLGIFRCFDSLRSLWCMRLVSKEWNTAITEHLRSRPSCSHVTVIFEEIDRPKDQQRAHFLAGADERWSTLTLTKPLADSKIISSSGHNVLLQKPNGGFTIFKPMQSAFRDLPVAWNVHKSVMGFIWGEKEALLVSLFPAKAWLLQENYIGDEYWKMLDWKNKLLASRIVTGEKGERIECAVVQHVRDRFTLMLANLVSLQALVIEVVLGRQPEVAMIEPPVLMGAAAEGHSGAIVFFTEEKELKMIDIRELRVYKVWMLVKEPTRGWIWIGLLNLEPAPASLHRTLTKKLEKKRMNQQQQEEGLRYRVIERLGELLFLLQGHREIHSFHLEERQWKLRNLPGKADGNGLVLGHL